MKKLILVLALAGLCLAAIAYAPALGSAAAFPGLPGVHVHLPEPEKAAYFDVVVEGTTVDRLTTEMSGEAAPAWSPRTGPWSTPRRTGEVAA
ncbi:MAG: hypothetical protein JST31_03705 [Actinobacteria bacterium]|nr:hypothetical protein [Actinomycetota bacterium]